MNRRYRIRFVGVWGGYVGLAVVEPQPRYEIEEKRWFGWSSVSCPLSKAKAEELLKVIENDPVP